MRTFETNMFKPAFQIGVFLRSAFGLSPPSNSPLGLQSSSNRLGGFIELPLHRLKYSLRHYTTLDILVAYHEVESCFPG